MRSASFLKFPLHYNIPFYVPLLFILTLKLIKIITHLKKLLFFVFTYASFNQIKSKHEMSAGNKQKNERKIKRKFSEVVCVQI